jgi:hypothetical protein
MLEREHMHLEDFDVRDRVGDAHEVKVSVVTSLEGNRRLLRNLRNMGNGLRTSTQEHVD